MPERRRAAGGGGTKSWRGPFCFWLSLHAQHLLEAVQHLDEIRLVRHHLVDVLVGAGDLVKHPFVFSTHYSRGLKFQIRNGKPLLCRLTAHAAPGAVGARLEALGRALAAYDVAVRAHAAGNDAELAPAGADRALARQPDVLAVVELTLDIVVVAVDRRVGRLERWQVPAHRLEHQVHDLGDAP